MKKYSVIASTLLALALTACGGKHDHVYAVDALEEAQANALANAPKAESITFNDEKSSVATATENVATQSNDTATAEATAEEAQASNTAEATAEAKPAQ